MIMTGSTSRDVAIFSYKSKLRYIKTTSRVLYACRDGDASEQRIAARA